MSHCGTTSTTASSLTRRVTEKGMEDVVVVKTQFEPLEVDISTSHVDLEEPLLPNSPPTDSSTTTSSWNDNTNRQNDDNSNNDGNNNDDNDNDDDDDDDDGDGDDEDQGPETYSPKIRIFMLTCSSLVGVYTMLSFIVFFLLMMTSMNQGPTYHKNPTNHHIGVKVVTYFGLIILYGVYVIVAGVYAWVLMQSATLGRTELFMRIPYGKIIQFQSGSQRCGLLLLIPAIMPWLLLIGWFCGLL